MPPIPFFDFRGDVDRFRPCLSLVAAVHDEDVAAAVLRSSCTKTAIHRQPDRAGFMVDDGAWITEFCRRVAVLFIDKLRRQPRCATISAPSQQHVDVAVIGTVRLSAFAEHQQCSLRRDNQSRNSIRVITASTADENGSSGSLVAVLVF